MRDMLVQALDQVYHRYMYLVVKFGRKEGNTSKYSTIAMHNVRAILWEHSWSRMTDLKMMYRPGAGAGARSTALLSRMDRFPKPSQQKEHENSTRFFIRHFHHFPTPKPIHNVVAAVAAVAAKVKQLPRARIVFAVLRKVRE